MGVVLNEAFWITVKLTAWLGPPEALARVKAIKIYATTNLQESRGISSSYAGQITNPAEGSSVELGSGCWWAIVTEAFPPSDPTLCEDYRNFLTGVSGYTQTISQGIVQVDDIEAQAELADRLGEDTDDPEAGVIAITIDGGDIDATQAAVLGRAYLDEVLAIAKRVTYSTFDDDSREGQTISVNYAEFDFSADAKIQGVSLSGFEKGMPHRYKVSAGPDIPTLEDLLKKSLGVNTNPITET